MRSKTETLIRFLLYWHLFGFVAAVTVWVLPHFSLAPNAEADPLGALLYLVFLVEVFLVSTWYNLDVVVWRGDK